MNSVRGRLVLLTISLLIPALLSMSVLLAGANREGRAQLDQQLLTTARALSGAMDRQTAVGLAVAETLSSDQALLAGDWQAFHARALRVTQKRKGWVVLADADGQQVVNTLKPFGTPLPRSQRTPEMAKAFTERRSEVSNLRPGHVAQGYVVTVATPVTIKGQAYMMAYVVDSSVFAAVMNQQRAPKGWVISLLDGNHKVIARSVRNALWTGHLAPTEMAGHLSQSGEGVRSVRSLEGVRSLMAYTRSPQTRWTLIVEVQEASLAQAMTTSMLRATGVFLLLLALGIGLALFFARGINREVGRLAAAARAIGQGQPIATPPDRGLEEIDAIEAALSAASRELQARQDRQTLMINELNHRVKNTLATVQALARQTFGKADSRSVEVFTDRLIALSGAHDLLTRGGWNKADLGELLAACMGPHGERILRSGPDVPLDPHTAVALSMVFHELATNSAKYGALSAPAGQVSLIWRIDPDTRGLALMWIETGGPSVRAPGKPGFGTRLIDGSIRRELKGEANFDFRPQGLVFQATLPPPVSDAGRWVNPV